MINQKINMIKIFSRVHMSKNFAIFVFFLFISLINFWGSLHNSFIIDDTEHYLSSKKVNNSFLIYDVIPNQTFAANPGMQEYQNNWGYYRPFMHVFFRVQAEIFKDNPVHYHLLCIIFFAWACFSIFQLLLFITKNEMAAFLAAFLYLLHPFQGLCVNYKTAVTLSIQIILLNSAFLMTVNTRSVLSKDFPKYVGALLCFILALLIHELAFIFPAILFFYWLILHDKSTKNLLYQWVGFVLISVLYLWVRSHYESFLGSPHYKVTLKEFLAAYAREINWVIKKLIYPKDIFLQSSTWLTKSIANQWILVFYTYVICFSLLLIIFYRRNKVLFFFLGVFISGFILSVPASKGFLRDGIVYFEPHWIFYTNIGLFGIVGYLFSFVLKEYKKLGILVLISYVLYLFYFSFIENRLYHDTNLFFERWSADSPSLDLPQYVVCDEKIALRKLDEAIDCFTPLTQRIRGAGAYTSLGQIYFLKDDYKRSKENFQKSREMGANTSALKNLSFIADKEGKTEEAIKYLDEALLFDKFSLDIPLAKVILYSKDKKWKEAIDVLHQVERIYPNNERILLSQINILFQMKDDERARLLVSQAIPHLTRVDTLVLLTIVLLQNHEDKLAEITYKKAYNIDSKQAQDISKSMFICPLDNKKKKAKPSLSLHRVNIVT
jgi:tetratricopeptide (TPR) repeat protein